MMRLKLVPAAITSPGFTLQSPITPSMGARTSLKARSAWRARSASREAM